MFQKGTNSAIIMLGPYFSNLWYQMVMHSNFCHLKNKTNGKPYNKNYNCVFAFNGNIQLKERQYTGGFVIVIE